MRAGVALALACLTLGAGCAGGGQASRRADVHWLERLARWQGRIEKTENGLGSTYFQVLGGTRTPHDLDQAVAPIRTCSRRLRTQVGKPPSDRFQDAFDLFGQACGHLERSADEMARSFRGTPGDALRSMEAEFSKGFSIILAARRMTEQSLLANRQLTTEGGRRTQSRIEPRLSRVASGIARRKAEIRCWSAHDWPQVVGEWGAYIGTTDIGAFAQPNNDRASLAPDTCEALASLLYEGRRPQRGGARDDLAIAVDTLAHESEHLASPAGSEAETECYAMQDMRGVARRLGAPRSYAASLAELYWRELYERLPDEYVSQDCADGGPWDANRSSSIWP